MLQFFTLCEHFGEIMLRPPWRVLINLPILSGSLYFVLFFFLPTSQESLCRDPSTVEYNVCALINKCWHAPHEHLSFQHHWMVSWLKHAIPVCIPLFSLLLKELNVEPWRLMSKTLPDCLINFSVKPKVVSLFHVDCTAAALFKKAV